MIKKRIPGDRCQLSILTGHEAMILNFNNRYLQYQNVMAFKNQVLDMTPVGMRFTVLQTAADTEGKSLDLHWELLPGCNMQNPLVHIHPHAIETYEVLEGEMEVFIKNKWLTAKKGDYIVVPLGVTHCFRNPSDEVVKVFNTHEPALKMEDYFEDVVRILDIITNNRTDAFTMNFKTKLYMSALMNKYRHEIIATSPPDFAIRLLGLVAKWKGIRI
jgi:mannose-6-phosphate isomerase-like protein (cupin superfamily)